MPEVRQKVILGEELPFLVCKFKFGTSTYLEFYLIRRSGILICKGLLFKRILLRCQIKLYWPQTVLN